MLSVVCLSIFEYLQPASVFWFFHVFCEQNAISCLKIAQTGWSEPWIVEAAPPWKSSEWHSWLMWERQIVGMMGSLSLKNYESSEGGKLNCPLLCGSRSLCLSQKSFIFGKSHNVSGLKMKGLELMSFRTRSTPGFCEDSAWMLYGRSYLHLLVFCS